MKIFPRLFPNFFIVLLVVEDSEKPDRLASIYFRRSGDLLNESDSEDTTCKYDRESAVESGLEPRRLSGKSHCIIICFCKQLYSCTLVQLRIFA